MVGAAPGVKWTNHKDLRDTPHNWIMRCETCMARDSVALSGCGARMMRGPAGLRTASIAAAVLAACVSAKPATAGEVADKAALAETLLDRGYAEAGLAAFDKAADAFWKASPLQLRVITFADSVSGYGDYAPRPDSVFRNGDTLRIYLEPVGYGFSPDGDGVTAAIAVDVEIRTPGGLILGSADDLVRLEWTGKRPMHEVQASVALPLPDLKPGAYELLLTLRDQGSSKVKDVTLPFTVAE
jgi:hypothetical protein